MVHPRVLILGSQVAILDETSWRFVQISARPSATQGGHLFLNVIQKGRS